jgi:hypothetical protein
VRVIRDFRDRPDSPPEPVLAIDEEELRRLLNLRSKESVKRALAILESGDHLLSDTDRPARWVKRDRFDPRGPGRERLLVFRGVASDHQGIRFRQVYRGLLYDERRSGDDAPDDPPRTRIRVIPV